MLELYDLSKKYLFIKYFAPFILERNKECWLEAKAKYKTHPPKDIDAVTPIFQDMTIKDKYKSLLRFGHGTLLNIIQDLPKKTIRRVSDPKGTTHLTEIINNKDALEKIHAASSLRPTIKLINQIGYFNIFYN